MVSSKLGRINSVKMHEGLHIEKQYQDVNLYDKIICEEVVTTVF